MLTELFETSCEEIGAAYAQLGHRLGWRFVTNRKETFKERVDVALITLNPAGARDVPEHPRESSEAGSAYVVECWEGYPRGRAPLQQQVQLLFESVGRALQKPSGPELLEQSLSAHFIPFRSPTLKALVNRPQSIAFASGLWARILPALEPRVIITMDQTSTPVLSRILSSYLGVAPATSSFQIGWGNYEASLLRFNAVGGSRVILRFPHLSRFAIFGRQQSPSVRIVGT